MNSVLETTRAGKPALFIPIFGDQFQVGESFFKNIFSRFIREFNPTFFYYIELRRSQALTFQNAAMVSRKNSSKIIWKTELKGRAVVNALKELLEDEGSVSNQEKYPKKSWFQLFSKSPKIG